MKRADDADTRERGYEDEHDEQPDGIHLPMLSAAIARACRATLSDMTAVSRA